MRYFVAVAILFCSVIASANVFPMFGGGAAYQAVAVFTSFIDSFTRSNNTDISTGSPTPPDSWYEFTQGATDSDCDISIGTNELVFDINDADCANTDMYALAEYGVGSVDHCVSYAITDISNWQSNRGSRGILRYTNVFGNHYELRGSTPAWDNMRVEVMSSDGVFQNALTDNADCAPGPMSVNDRVGLCVEGAGDETVFTVFAIPAASVGSIDIEDATTWGSFIECTLTAPFDNTDRVETGDRLGVGFNVSSAMTLSDTAAVDNFAATDAIYVVPGSGPARTDGLPTGVKAIGTTSIAGSLTTDVNATCKWDTTAGVAYASMANTFAGTGTKSHTTTFGSLVNSTAYTRYVKCTDGVDPNPTDYLITFSVDYPQEIVSLGVSAVSGGLNLNWDDSRNQLDGANATGHYEVQWEPDPAAWAGAETDITPDPTESFQAITGLSNGTTYDVRVRECDSTSTVCSAYSYDTGTPAVPPVSANEEARCTALGANCVCSEPVEFDATNMADPFNFTDTDSTKECWGTRTGAFAGAQFSSGGTEDTVDISAGAGWGDATRAVHWDNGFMWWNPPNVQSGALAIGPNVRTYCMRYYMKVTSDFASSGGDPGNPAGECPNTTWRNKLMQANYGIPSEYVQIQLIERGAFSCPAVPNYTPFAVGIGGTPDVGTFNLTGASTLTYQDCNEAPCSVEMCVDGNVAEGTNLAIRARVTSLEGAGKSVEVTSPTFNATAGVVFPDFWGGDFYHSGGTGSMDVSHFMVATWDTDANDWIGASSEVEP